MEVQDARFTMFRQDESWLIELPASRGKGKTVEAIGIDQCLKL